MERKRGYYQFCPVAKAAEIFAERWTPLVLRELLSGSRRFNDLRRGLPRMSQSLLSRRLTELEDAGIVERLPPEKGRGWQYALTAAGEELRPIVEQLGVWGYRWAQKEVTRDDLDAGLLMWDMQRRLNTDHLPDARVMVHFYFPDAGPGFRRFWLLLDHGEVDLCLTNPGHEVDLTVESSVLTMAEIWLGDITIAGARKKGRLSMEGPEALKRSFPTWLKLSVFADGERPIRKQAPSARSRA